MIFKSKEKLFHDIPNQGDSVSSKRYSRTTKNFAQWYYEEGLNDGAERAAAGLDPSSDDFSRFCKDKFPNALREAIDRYLDRKGPLVEFPEPESRSILIGDKVVNFDIFHSKYVKALSEGLDQTLGLLWECKFRHWGQHKREKRKTIQSMGLLLLLSLILALDLPALLIDGPVQAVYAFLKPLLPWKEKSVAHLLIPGVIDLILCGVVGGILIWKTVSRMPKHRQRAIHGYGENNVRSVVSLTGLVWPFVLLVRVGMGASFLEGVWMVQAAAESATGSLSVIDALTACLSSGLFMAGILILIYAVALLDQVGYYLYLLRHEEGLLAKEARLTVEDAKLQWSHYHTYIKELVSTDRQLKFLEIWNQAVGGKGQFSGLFDINSYVKKGEDSLLPDNIPLLRTWEAKQEEQLALEQKGEQQLKEQKKALQKQEQSAEKAEAVFEIASEEARKDALSRFPLCFDKAGKLAKPEEAFALLRTALGFSRLVPAEPYPSDAPGAREYRDGFQCECTGRNYMVAKEHYEAAAKQGHLLALARLANIYDTDRNLDSVIAYGDALSVEQWPHPMEHEAEETRRMMGLTPQSAVSCLLRYAWNPQVGFDLDVLYCLALHCIGSRNVEEEITRAVCLFASALLTGAAEQEDARCAFYLAKLNFDYYKDRKSSHLWAKASAGLRYGPALYFLYEHQKELSLDGETARMYCYQAWENNYPPARICAVWDKLTEARRKEMERQINRAKETALREARERQKRAQLETYKKQLEDRERVLNLVLHNAYLDDDAAYMAGVMSADELMMGKMLKEEKLDKHKKELDQE